MSSDSDYYENPPDHQSEGEENEDEEKPTTSNGTANGNDIEKPVTWNDLV